MPETGPATAPLTTRAAWVMVLALCAGVALSQAFRTVGAIMASPLQSDFRLSAQALGIFSGAFHFAFGAADAGSCTQRQIASHASAEAAASTTNPARHEYACTSQASGVPVTSMPMPPIASTSPETVAKRAAGKCRAMNTVHTRKAGAQPTPISACPATSTR